MKVYYKKFFLQPKKALNRLSGINRREGVFFFSETKTGIHFSEYFPHPEFGDDSVDAFLNNFQSKNNNTYFKTKYFLSLEIQELTSTPFLNHQLWRKDEKIYSKVIKYKIKDFLDLHFLDILDQVDTIRLDANGIFDFKGIQQFASLIPEKHHSKIEYIEDPTFDLNWSEMPFKVAKDFLNGNTFDYLIHKPSRSNLPDIQCQTIFSGNMGHAIGQYHDFRELLQKGNLKLYHGLVTPSLYDDVPDLFIKDAPGDIYHFSFNNFNSFLTSLQQENWTYLCQLT